MFVQWNAIWQFAITGIYFSQCNVQCTTSHSLSLSLKNNQHYISYHHPLYSLLSCDLPFSFLFCDLTLYNQTKEETVSFFLSIFFSFFLEKVITSCFSTSPRPLANVQKNLYNSCIFRWKSKRESCWSGLVGGDGVELTLLIACVPVVYYFRYNHSSWYTMRYYRLVFLCTHTLLKKMLRGKVTTI